MTLQIIDKHNDLIVASVDIDGDNVVGIVKDGFAISVDGKEITDEGK